ncbi:hypothetical protein Pmani_002331 [Petrolisthes manimaculis]|uniref:pseudouridine 5'-phosphatase n=1 Tax=Petrolisthes manimaculis TaxID=1843537 RepID=A0AAE1UR37_9EUCA|nr:hypothetical protein Pmani_002331 [Petrolisthes manimaculis]
MIADEYDKVYTWEVKVGCMGMKEHISAQRIIQQLNLPLSVDQYLDKIHAIYPTLFPTAQLLPGADKLVRHLHKHKIPFAIASGGTQDSYNLKTTNHQHFIDLFSHVVLATSDVHVKNGKPAPDVFLVCASRFPGQPPKPDKCLVFEDAPNGVSAAVSAKMQVVMVPDNRLDTKSMSHQPTQILNSLEGFIPELFGLPAYD